VAAAAESAAACPNSNRAARFFFCFAHISGGTRRGAYPSAPRGRQGGWLGARYHWVSDTGTSVLVGVPV
jgi:hypothetical protein